MLDSKSIAIVTIIMVILFTMFKPSITRYYDIIKYKLYRLLTILYRYIFGGLSDF